LQLELHSFETGAYTVFQNDGSFRRHTGMRLNKKINGVKRYSSMKKTSQSGMGIVSILTLIFIVLKLTKLISWSWVWVLSPLWITAVLTLIVFSLILIGGKIKKGKW